MYGDWSLTSQGRAYRFGTPSHPVEVVDWAFAGDGYRTDDTSNPRADGLAFGQDFIDPGELSIQLQIDFTTYPAGVVECARRAWSARTEFSQAWRADGVRGRPGELSELIVGGEFMIEGRSRRVVWDDSAQNVGFIRGQAYFSPAGTGLYDVSGAGGGWNAHTIGLMPPQHGGIRAPIKAPVTTAYESSRARSFEVGGIDPVWPIVTIKGPLMTGAQLELTGGWRMPLNRALGAFDVARIDTRPGHRSMTLNGRPANLLRDDAVMLSDASIAPGMQEIALRGRSLEGTATASIEWLNRLGRN